MNLIFKKRNISPDCVNYILGYDERFAIRRGVVVNRLRLTNKRYIPLLSIPQKNITYDNISVYIPVNINKDFSITYNPNFDNDNTRCFMFTIVSYVFDETNSGNGYIDYPNTKNITINI